MQQGPAQRRHDIKFRSLPVFQHSQETRTRLVCIEDRPQIVLLTHCNQGQRQGLTRLAFHFPPPHQGPDLLQHPLGARRTENRGQAPPGPGKIQLARPQGRKPVAFTVMHRLRKGILDPAITLRFRRRGRNQNGPGLGRLPGRQHRFHPYQRMRIASRRHQQVMPFLQTITPASRHPRAIGSRPVIGRRQQALQNNHVRLLDPLQGAHSFQQRSSVLPALQACTPLPDRLPHLSPLAVHQNLLGLETRPTLRRLECLQ